MSVYGVIFTNSMLYIADYKSLMHSPRNEFHKIIIYEFGLSEIVLLQIEIDCITS